MTETGAPLPEKDYSGLFPKVDYAAMFPKMDYAALFPKVDYSALFPKPDYSGLFPKVDYAAMFPKMDYSALFPKPDYSGLFPKVDYAAILPKMDLPVLSSLTRHSAFGSLGGTATALAQLAVERLSGSESIEDVDQATVDERFAVIAASIADTEMDTEFERRIALVEYDDPAFESALEYWGLAEFPRGRELKIIIAALGTFATSLLFVAGMLAAPEQTAIIRDTIGVTIGVGSTAFGAIKWSEKARRQLGETGSTDTDS